MGFNKSDATRVISDGKAVLGIEFGSTRIKAVLIDKQHEVIGSGSYEWENRYENNLWTYSLEDIYTGLKSSYADLKKNVKEEYGVTIKKLASLGISAMMHGFIALDKEAKLLTPFRTWRNTNTVAAADELTSLLKYNIPIRWSIAHLYQAILNKEDYIDDINYIGTLAAYIHWALTGEKVLGVGDASGMFPIDSTTHDYHAEMVVTFDKLVESKGYALKFADYMPKVLVAGEEAGLLSNEGALLLDEEGDLQAGIPLCPPEGDAGTGMAATNSVAKRTGNVSAGTSIFLMAVLERELSKVYTELDMVTTPSGDPVAMVHCNNCTSDINAWVGLFKEYLEATGAKVDMNELFTTLYKKALEGDADCGGLLSYNYVSGEPITGFDEGCPVFVRSADSKFNLANFMRAHILSAMGALRVGMDILTEEEHVELDKLLGHGGLFKTEGVGQSLMAAAMNTPVTVMETAGEGGAWGIAVLAAYLANKETGESFPEYLDNKVFGENAGVTLAPRKEDIEGFASFMDKYIKGLPIEKEAVKLYY
jgi:sugar (pentulose or hexulose) kinase